MAKETKKVPSNGLLANLDIHLATVKNYSNLVTVLPQVQHLVIPITRQLIGHIGDKAQKGTALTNYVRNIIYASYHAQQSVEFVRALQTAIDLASVYLLDQRKDEKQSIIMAVANTVDFLGCKYLLTVEGLDREVDPNTVVAARAYVNNEAAQSARMIDQFRARAFPNQQPAVQYDGGYGNQSTYYNVDNPVHVLPDYRHSAASDPYGLHVPEMVQAPPISKFIFRPIKMDSTSWAYDMTTKRPLYTLEGDDTYYYVHLKGDNWIIVNRSTMARAGEAEFRGCAIATVEGLEPPKEEGYENKLSSIPGIIASSGHANKPQAAEQWTLESFHNVTEVTPLGSAILEEVSFDPTNNEVTYSRSKDLPEEQAFMEHYATNEEINVTDFTTGETIETIAVEPTAPSKFANETTLSDGSKMVLASNENLASNLLKFREGEVPRYVPAYYPEEEMLFVKTNTNGTVDLVLSNDEEVIMNSQLERMMLASGISRTPHVATIAHKRLGKVKEEEFFSGIEVSLTNDQLALKTEREERTAFTNAGNPSEDFVFNGSLSFNTIITGADIYSATAQARALALSNDTTIPFRYHEARNFIPYEDHPAEQSIDGGERKIIEVIMKQDAKALVDCLINDYGLGTKLERMTPIAWYVHDTMLETINSFISQEMGLPKFVVLDNLHQDYSQAKDYIRTKKGLFIAQALESKTFISRLFAAIGNIEENINSVPDNEVTLTVISFIRINYVLYWGLESEQISFLMVDDTVVLKKEQTPALYNICLRVSEMASELSDRDEITVFNRAFVTKDNRLIRISRSPYSGDLLLTSIKAH